MGNIQIEKIAKTGVRRDSVSSSKSPATGQFVDGFVRPSRGATVAAVKKQPVSQKPQPISHLAPHRPEPTRTLMRSAVRKPDIVAPSKLKVQGRSDILVRTPSQLVAAKISHSTVDAKRLKKATQMIKHPHVSHYAPMSTLSSLQRPAPVSAQSVHNTSIDHIQSSLSRVAASPAAMPTIPVTAVPAAPVSNDIFAEALAASTSHQQVYDQPSKGSGTGRHRAAILVTSVLSLLLLAGTIAYFNAPELSMKFASIKAGFSARMPGYSPSGFNFGSLSYGKGNVTVNYASAIDSTRTYAITQRESNWDSQSLLTNFVSTANKAYQTYEKAGRTVYVYGDNTATWVDSGVWYTVNGNTALDRDQILALAGSL